MPYYPFTFTGDRDTDLATTDAYADVPLTTIDDAARQVYFQSTSSGPISVNWKNTGAQTIKTKVLGSNDYTLADADWDTAAAEATIAAGASRHVEIDLAQYCFYKFQHAANAAGLQGASSLKGAQKRI